MSEMHIFFISFIYIAVTAIFSLLRIRVQTHISHSLFPKNIIYVFVEKMREKSWAEEKTPMDFVIIITYYHNFIQARQMQAHQPFSTQSLQLLFFYISAYNSIFAK